MQGNTPAEVSALERWLEVEPTATRAMERLAELAHRAGESSRVVELRLAVKPRSSGARRPTASASGATSRFRARPSGPTLARLAESAGRRHEAHALYSWAEGRSRKFRGPGGSGPARSGRCRTTSCTLRERRRVARTLAGDASQDGLNASGPPRGLAFTDDTSVAGLDFVYDNAETPIHQLPEPFGGGLALLDYDGDGWLDVFCVQGGPFDLNPGNRESPLSVSPATGSFEIGETAHSKTSPRPRASPVSRGHGHGVTAGDIDGDGRIDLFVTRWRSYALYRNRGDGTFEDITDRPGWEAGETGRPRRHWADFDNDGDLDLYVCHYAAWDLDNPKICRDANKNAYLNCSPLVAEALPITSFATTAAGSLTSRPRQGSSITMAAAWE